MSDRRDVGTANTPTSMPQYERIIVGEALQSAEFFWRQMGRLKPQHFTVPRLARIWQALITATEKGRAPTKTWVPLYIDPIDSREEVPLMIELTLLINDLDEGREPDQFADTVFGLANKRAVLDAMVATHAKVLKSDISTTPAQLQDMAFKALSTSIEHDQENHQQSYVAWGREVYREIAANVNAGEETRGMGLPCGLRAVEEVIGRLMPGKVYVLAGMSGSGKSALVRQIVENAMAEASALAIGAAYIGSLEMTGKDYAIRALAQRMGIPGEQLERGAIEPAQLDALYGHVSELEKYNIVVDDTPNMRFDDMKARMQKIKISRGLALAVIDHLLIIGAEKGETLFDKVTNATMKAKNTAKELNIPIILLAQLTEKKILETASGWPNASHLFGGETITQNADVVAFIHRHELVLSKKEPATETEAHAKWVKRMDSLRGKANFFNDKRRGGAGRITREMNFYGPTMHFEDI